MGRAQGALSEASVTVVVPTCNRSDFLRDVIVALSHQTHSSFRAVIVDDGSVDDTVRVVTAAIGGDSRFSVISQKNRGPAAARNAACRSATTEWLAFTDDDCIPQPTWLAELLATAEGCGADLVQGTTLNDPSVCRAELPWFARGKQVKSWSGRFETCNLLMRRPMLAEIGGFDETFPARGFGEDTDVGLRLVKAGAKTAFASEAVVHHRVLVMSYQNYLRRKYRWAQVVHLVAVNPDARSTFPHRYVAQRVHVALWLALPPTAGALAAGLWVLPLLMFLAFIVHRVVATRTEGRSVATRVARAPLELVGVAVEAYGFVVESARHRCLLV